MMIKCRVYGVTAGALLTMSLVGCSSSSTSSPATSTSSVAKCSPAVPDTALIQPGTLVDVVSDDLPPMSYKDKNNNYVGMRVELGQMLAAKLCLKFKVTSALFDAQLTGLAGKRWDMVGSGAFYTAARAQVMSLVPYEVQGVAVSVAKGNPKNVHNVTDLAGLTVGVESPGFEFDTLQAINQQLKTDGKNTFHLQGFNNTTDAYNALKAGQVDAVGIIGAVVNYYTQSGDFSTAITGLNPNALALGFQNKTLATAAAKALEAMRSDGSLAKEFDKYGATMWTGPFQVDTGPLAVPSTAPSTAPSTVASSAS